MKKVVILLGLVAITFVGVTYVRAQEPGFGPGHIGMGSKRFFLTPEQKTKLQELHRKLNEETAQFRGALLTKRLELRSLWSDLNANAKTIFDKEKEFRELQNQMMEKVVQYKLEVRKLLTPDQIIRFWPGGGMGPGLDRGLMMDHYFWMGYPGPGSE